MKIRGLREWERRSFTRASGKCAGFAVLTALLVWGSFAGRGQAQVTNLGPNQSINLSQLTGTNGLSVEVGDKLFGNFQFQYSDNDGNTGNDLTASALVLTTLSNQVGYGISLTGPMVALGNVMKDIVVRFSVTVTNSNQLISDVHLDYNGTIINGGFSSVTESVFTGGFGANRIDQIGVFDLSNTNQLTAAANLPSPQQKIYIEKDIIFAGNATGDVANISVVDQTFSQVPEPSTIFLSWAGFVSLFFVRRRK